MRLLDAPPITTIKEKLLADIRKGEESPDLLGKRYGLNGHDLVKNLEQLRKEGLIRVQWGPGDRIIRVKPNREAENMAALKGHGRHANGKIDYIDRVADAINRLPWGDNGFRVWSRADVMRWTELNNDQVGHALNVLRDTGRLQQLGGGGRGIPLQGVRWRGEKAPEAPERAASVESVPDKPKAPSGPSQAVRDTAAYLQSHQKPAPVKTETLYPKLTAALERWQKMEEANRLLRETGNDSLAESLAENNEYAVMSPIGPELEQLLGARQ